MNADEARCVGEMTRVPVRKYKGIEHFDPRLFLEAPFYLLMVLMPTVELARNFPRELL